jgi:hypothetical protein
MRNIAIVWSIAGAALLAAACGGSSGSTFPGGSGQSSGQSGDGSQGSNGTPPDLLGGGPSGTNAACVTSTANAALSPANLVVMYDKSGSMGDTSEGFDPALKWTPVNQAMEAFFGDPGSAGLSASLQLFPQGTDLSSVCGYDYATPKVPLSALGTNPNPLTAALQATSPSGGTPTLPAMQGAVAYAKQVAAQQPQSKTVIVLVTDGDPGFGINGQFAVGCTNNDIPHVAAAAEAALQGSPSIPTYVIGVGSDFTNLNAIAAGGGTKQATIVSVTDPAKTSGIFQQALDAIRAQTLSCDFALPQPPSGQQINPLAVNVVFDDGSGKQTTLTYDATCASGAGWHYDDLAAPTKVELCPATCQAVQADAKGALTLAFGCKTFGVTK